MTLRQPCTDTKPAGGVYHRCGVCRQRLHARYGKKTLGASPIAGAKGGQRLHHSLQGPWDKHVQEQTLAAGEHPISATHYCTGCAAKSRWRTAQDKQVSIDPLWVGLRGWRQRWRVRPWVPAAAWWSKAMVSARRVLCPSGRARTTAKSRTL